MQTVLKVLIRFLPDLYVAFQDLACNFLLRNKLQSCADFAENVELAQHHLEWNHTKNFLGHKIASSLPEGNSSDDKLFSSLSKRSVSGKFKFVSLAQPFMEEFLYSFLLTPRSIPSGLKSHKSHSRNPSNSSNMGQAGNLRPTRLKYTFTLTGSGQPPLIFCTRYYQPLFWGGLFTYPQYDVKSVLTLLTPDIISSLLYAILSAKNVLIVAKNADLLYPAVQLLQDLLSPM